ncbi:MAG: hypothetical protein JO286_27180 [Solirubrobacterales bacterium]|nr:hypothetical protein [Solirubrobacterales bacterium]
MLAPDPLLRDALELSVALPLPSLWLARFARWRGLACPPPELACRLVLLLALLRPLDPLLCERDPLLREPDPLLREPDPLLREPDPLLCESDPLLCARDPLLRLRERDPVLSLCAREPLLRDAEPLLRDALLPWLRVRPRVGRSPLLDDSLDVSPLLERLEEPRPLDMSTSCCCIPQLGASGSSSNPALPKAADSANLYGRMF